MTLLIFGILLGAVAICTYLYVLRQSHLSTSVNEIIREPVFLKLSVPLNNEKNAPAAEQLLQALHGILRNNNKSKDLFSFEIVANSSGIFFIIVCDLRYRQFVENQIYAQYPDAQITQIHDYVEQSIRHHGAGRRSETIELSLGKEFFYPLKTYQNFEVDPLASITGAISKLSDGDEVWIQILARPVEDSWQEKGKQYINSRKSQTDDEGKKIGLESGESDEIRKIEYKNTKSGFQFVIRIQALSKDEMQAANLIEDVEASFKQFQTAQFNYLAQKKPLALSPIQKILKLIKGKRFTDIYTQPIKFNKRFLDEHENAIASTEELASMYHLPNKSVQTPSINWTKSRKLPPPAELPTEHARMFAVTDYRNIRKPVGIKKEDRRRHMYLLGKTGTGKSMMLKNLIMGDIYDGEGVAVVDPHGDLVEDILALIPEHRIKDVVYLDPSDIEFPVGLNMLDLKEGESAELLADGIVSVFIKLFGHSWGPRLQYLLNNTILTLLSCQNVSLLAVQRILLDKNYRKFLLKQVKDPFLKNFWEEEYEQMAKNPKLITEAIAPIQNKVGRFLSSPMVRNMIGQIKSSVDLSQIMNSGKILLINLSQGKIGEENTHLLGGMLITRLYTNAMQRANIPSAHRRDFYLYVDEFQNFATDTFVKILSEARKYGLNLTVTHQFIDQIQPKIQDAIFGNVGTLMNYVVGPKDAARLEKEFSPDLTAEDLVNLEKFRMTLKLTIDGAQSKPFTAIALPPRYQNVNMREQIIQASRETYGSARTEIEQKLVKWASQRYTDKGNLESV